MGCRRFSGASVSARIAAAVSGVDEARTANLLASLRYEASLVEKPKRAEYRAWIERQRDLLRRPSTDITPADTTDLRAALTRLRDTTPPDGPEFYAWSHIEARARQERAIYAAPRAVDLDPPGSHAHAYTLGPDGRPTRVWYASYGSNLHRDRFLTYLQGGRIEGNTRTYAGCRDRTPPADDIPIRFTGARPHFAMKSRTWNSGGVAFIDSSKDPEAVTLGRAYDITVDQFDQVVAQENGLGIYTATKVPLDRVLGGGRVVTGNGWYETMVHIGDYQGQPVVTFTAPFTANQAIGRWKNVNDKGTVTSRVYSNRPSPAYARMIGSGLEETFGMSKVAQADYIRGCPGGDAWSRKDLVAVLRGTYVEPTPNTGNRAGGHTTGGGLGSIGTPHHNRPSGATTSATGPRTPTFTAPSYATTDTPLTTGTGTGTGTGGGGGSGSGSGSGPGRGRNRGNSTASAQTVRAATTTGVHPAVATYGSAEEQAHGVRRWTERLKAANAALTATDTAYARARDEGNDTDRLLAQVRRADLQSQVSELRAKVRYARTQRPPRHFNPEVPRTRVQWMEIDEAVLNRHRTLTDKHERARETLRTLTRQGAPGAKISEQRSRVDRLQSAIADAEGQLQEIHDIMDGRMPGLAAQRSPHTTTAAANKAPATKKAATKKASKKASKKSRGRSRQHTT